MSGEEEDEQQWRGSRREENRAGMERKQSTAARTQIKEQCVRIITIAVVGVLLVCWYAATVLPRYSSRGLPSCLGGPEHDLGAYLHLPAPRSIHIHLPAFADSAHPAKLVYTLPKGECRCPAADSALCHMRNVTHRVCGPWVAGSSRAGALKPAQSSC